MIDMKKVLFSFVFFLTFLFSPSLNASHLYVYLVCDTHADQIEESVEADYRNMRREIRRICRYTGLKPCINRYIGYSVNDGIFDKIRQLEVNEDDVVIFYYSGHGLRFTEQSDQWPVLDFEYGKREVTQWEVTQELMNKRPRLILSLADCCNNFIETSGLIRGNYRDKQENYRQLFLYSSGTYIASGASPGEYSFGMNENWWSANLLAGGFFTNALLEIIRQETRKENPGLSWENVFELAVLKTHEYQTRDKNDPSIYQTPQYLYIDHR